VSNGELAKKVAEMREEGAPNWGVSLYIEMNGLREEFSAHCASSRWWNGIGEKVLTAVLVPMALALAYGLIRFLAVKLP
jgi:hypothetical protein